MVTERSNAHTEGDTKMVDPIQIKTPRGVTKDQFLDMVRAGTHDAIVELMRAGSDNPGADFFAAIKDGIAEAVKAVARDRAATTGTPEPPHHPGDPGGGPVQP